MRIYMYYTDYQYIINTNKIKKAIPIWIIVYSLLLTKMDSLVCYSDKKRCHD